MSRTIKTVVHTDCGPILVEAAESNAAQPQQQLETTTATQQHVQRRSQRLIVKSGGGGRVGNVQRTAALKTASDNGGDVDEQIAVQTVEHPNAERDSAVNDIEDDDAAEEKECGQMLPNDWMKMATLISSVLFLFVLLLNLFLDDAFTLFGAFILGTGTVWASLFYADK